MRVRNAPCRAPTAQAGVCWEVQLLGGVFLACVVTVRCSQLPICLCWSQTAACRTHWIIYMGQRYNWLQVLPILPQFEPQHGAENFEFRVWLFVS